MDADRRREVFALTSMGALLVSLDVSIANALLPAIGESFGGSSRAALSWVISAYAIAFGAVLVPAGRLADRAGRRRVFAGGFALFALGSLVCGLAPALPFLLAGRVVQAVGAAAAQPASLGLLLAATPAADRSSYTARFFGMGAVGIGLGPVIGGALTALASWRWAFLVNLPLVAVVLLATPRVLAETERHPGRRLPDPLGALVLAGGAALLTLALSQATTWGWLDARTDACALAGVVLLAAFVVRCRTVADPVLDLELLRDRRFALVTLVTVCYSAGFFGLLLSFVLFLVSTWGLTIVEAGLAIAPMALIVLVLSTRVGPLAQRIGFRAPLTAGAALIAAGLVVSALVDGAGHFGAQWVAVTLLCGTGIGLCYPLLGAAAVAGLPVGVLAAASAVNQCARQLGAALGVAATVAAIGPASPAPVSRFHLAWLVCAGFALLAAGAATAVRERRVATRVVAAEA